MKIKNKLINMGVEKTIQYKRKRRLKVLQEKATIMLI
jgi:hypothetical protein